MCFCYTYFIETEIEKQLRLNLKKLKREKNMGNPQYYFAKSNFQIVGEVEELAPARPAEVDQAYHAFRWSVTAEEYRCVKTGIYKGHGQWVDAKTGEDLSLDFKWSDYLVPVKYKI